MHSRQPIEKEQPFDVYSYTKNNLAKALSNKYITEQQIISKKGSHYNYLLDYFGKANSGLYAKTIVVEKEYVSRSFLQDYSNFYSTCFHQYDRFCKRVHFFKIKFTEDVFKEIITFPKEKNADIWESYLGYVVIRPLPYAIVGATLLRTFNCDKTHRYYPATRDYHINIFGKELILKTLAFQEQDAVVGACASSALWSTFHKVSTQEYFHTKLPSPSEITKSVKSFNEDGGRRIPNRGLTIKQICETIDDLKLVPELFTDIEEKDIDFANIKWIKRIAYAYNKIGIPILLGITIKGEGEHLVTITGYRIGDREQSKMRSANLLADRIIKFYAHDDQVGPFSRIEINRARTAKNYQLITAWRKNGKKLPAKVICLCAPLSDEIRLDAKTIFRKINLLNYLLKFYLGNKIEWDIYLYFSNKYKAELIEEPNIPRRSKIKNSVLSMPKYVWLAKGHIGTVHVFDFVFDATNIAESNFCVSVNIYNSELRRIMRLTMKMPDTGVSAYINDKLGANYLDLISEEVKD